MSTTIASKQENKQFKYLGSNLSYHNNKNLNLTEEHITNIEHHFKQKFIWAAIKLHERSIGTKVSQLLWIFEDLIFVLMKATLYQKSTIHI